MGMRPLTDRASAALAYARRGWAVLPCHHPTPGGCSCANAHCASPAKHPRTRRGPHDATTDLRTIRRWWWRWPNANVGLRTGAVSGLVVLDVDPDHGGEASLAELVGAYASLPPTLEVRTGGRGRPPLLRPPGREGGQQRRWAGSGPRRTRRRRLHPRPAQSSRLGRHLPPTDLRPSSRPARLAPRPPDQEACRGHECRDGRRPGRGPVTGVGVGPGGAGSRGLPSAPSCGRYPQPHSQPCRLRAGSDHRRRSSRSRRGRRFPRALTLARAFVGSVRVVLARRVAASDFDWCPSRAVLVASPL